MNGTASARWIILAREIEGRTELVEAVRDADTIWLDMDGQLTVLTPDRWGSTFADLAARGFVEIWPVDRIKFAAEKERVAELIRAAFHGVTLGNGVGLREGQGLDDYAGKETLAAYRALDEKYDWSAISVNDLNYCSSSLSFFDADGMRFHLPAYLLAELAGVLDMADVLFHLVRLEYGAAARFQTLTSQQREAVREFLLLWLTDPDQEFYHAGIGAALRNYWDLA